MVIDDGDRDDFDADDGDDGDSDDCSQVVVTDDVKPVKTDSAGDRPSCETSHPKLVLDLAVERLLQLDEDEVEKDEDEEILMRNVIYRRVMRTIRIDLAVAKRTAVQ